jgi:hypothetical protein
VNRFEQSHAFGEAAADDPLWEEFYRALFPGLVSIAKNVRGNVGQFAGIDRWLCLSSGKVLSVDEKRRSVDYGDIALEFVSNGRRHAVVDGWIEKDLAIDYLAYAIIPARRCYLFPWPALRASWGRCAKEWIKAAAQERKGFKLIAAENPTYWTWSVCLPAEHLAKSVSQSLQVQIQPAVGVAA